MNGTTDKREQRAAAAEQIRLIMIEESDTLARILRVPWKASVGISLVFFIRLGGRRVNAEGEVVDKHDDGADYYGGDGLVAIWDLITDMRDRAAKLGLEVSPVIHYRATATLQKPGEGVASA